MRSGLVRQFLTRVIAEELGLLGSSAILIGFLLGFGLLTKVLAKNETARAKSEALYAKLAGVQGFGIELHWESKIASG